MYSSTSKEWRVQHYLSAPARKFRLVFTRASQYYCAVPSAMAQITHEPLFRWGVYANAVFFFYLNHYFRFLSIQTTRTECERMNIRTWIRRICYVRVRTYYCYFIIIYYTIITYTSAAVCLQRANIHRMEFHVLI